MQNHTSEKKRAVVAVTGASGIIYALRLLKVLMDNNAEIFCIATNSAKEILPCETGGAKDIYGALSRECPKEYAEKIENISFFDESDFSAPPASGSFFFDAMAVIPCSMKTLGKIANSIADNLVVRAAEVALKERRTLVVVPRETPLALTHLRNMCSLSEAGASILPACPAFYQKPKSVADIADFIAARAAMAMGFKQNIFKEWGYEEKL